METNTPLFVQILYGDLSKAELPSTKLAIRVRPGHQMKPGKIANVMYDAPSPTGGAVWPLSLYVSKDELNVDENLWTPTRDNFQRQIRIAAIKEAPTLFRRDLIAEWEKMALGLLNPAVELPLKTMYIPAGMASIEQELKYLLIITPQHLNEWWYSWVMQYRFTHAPVREEDDGLL